MAAYQTKREVVEASQWQGVGSTVPGVYVEGDAAELASYYVVTNDKFRISILPGDWIVLQSPQTLEGVVTARPWPPKAFEAKYEPVP